jgi:hypothetical protein
MLSLPKHLACAARVTNPTMQARCFGKLSMTCFLVEQDISKKGARAAMQRGLLC